MSRFAAVRWRVQPLVREHEEGQTRSLRNRIEARLDGDIEVLVTHIDRGPLKARMIGNALERLEAVEHGILLGDLNAQASHEGLVDLSTRGMVDALAGLDGYAHHIDWIIVKGGHVIGSGAVAKSSSDHPAYWADVRFPFGVRGP